MKWYDLSEALWKEQGLSGGKKKKSPSHLGLRQKPFIDKATGTSANV